MITATEQQMTIATQQQVIDVVREHVKDQHPGGSNLEVLTQGVRHEQDWWYVLIRPDKQPPKRYEYYEALAEVEVEILKKYRLTVLLVPVLPNEELTAA